MKTILTLCFALCSVALCSQQLYSDSEVHKLNLLFDQPDFWDQLTQNKEAKIDIPATLIVNDTATYDSVGVRFKGNSSYNIQQSKKPFNLSMDAFIEDQHLWGYETLNLNNCFVDPTFVREKIAYDVFRQYMPAGQAGYVALYINDAYWGLYVNVEQVNRDFLSGWFVSNDGNLYKGDPHGSLTPNPDVNRLKSDYEKKTNEEEDDWEDLFQLINILNTSNDLARDLPKILDIDRTLWYMALCNIFTNLDSYISSGHNYYIYHDPVSDKFHIIPWDLNEVFGCFPPHGTNFNFFAQYPLFQNTDNPNLPLVSRVLTVPDFKARYLAHCRTIVRHYFNPDTLAPWISALQSVITSYVEADTNRLYELSYFTENVQTDVTVAGNRLVPGLLHLAEERVAYLYSDPDFSAAAPTIQQAACTADTLAANSSVQFTAKVFDPAGLAKVNLYFKVGAGNFIKMQMRDDGTQGDTTANDSVYTCEVHIPEHASGQILSFYVLAENTGGHMTFFPEGAEFTVLSIPVSGELMLPPLVINEFMASNDNTLADPQGEYDDWVEIYNDGDFPTPVGGMYLSDNPDNPAKWMFPDTMIESKGYLLVWIDSDEEVTPGLHASFNLSKDGEFIGLYERDVLGNAVIDSVSFGAQSTDISFGRYPNITGEFTSLLNATPEAANALTDVASGQSVQPAGFQLMQNFPNPFNQSSVVSCQLSERARVKVLIYDILGRLVSSEESGYVEAGEHQIFIDAKNWSTGIYYFKIHAGRFHGGGKMLLIR